MSPLTSVCAGVEGKLHYDILIHFILTFLFSILLSSGVVRAVAGIPGDLAWRMPFVLQEIWPVPLFIAAYFAPESPWNAVRRGQMEEARHSLMRLSQDTPNKEHEVDATLAYIKVSCTIVLARRLSSRRSSTQQIWRRPRQRKVASWIASAAQTYDAPRL